MRPNKKNIILTIFITSILCSLECAMCSTEGRRQRHRKITRPLASYKEAYGHYKGELGRSKVPSHAEAGYNLQAESTATAPEQGVSSPIFNVLVYGAKGDGKADDTRAFEQVWQAACKQEGSTMLVPSGSVFLVKPISFSGPNCQPHIVFQLDGKIIAPTGSGSWGSGLLQWLEFTKLVGITIRGRGTIDGQGSVWWNNSPMDNLVDQNLKFDSCTGVQVFNLSVSSPGDSPNTDGIHLQNSKDVAIHSTNLACGVTLATVELKPLPGKQVYDPFCWETYGELKTTTTPRIDCLRTTKQPQKIVDSC